MAAFNSLKRATASPLVSKLLSPIRSASVAPAVSRSFRHQNQVNRSSFLLLFECSVDPIEVSLTAKKMMSEMNDIGFGIAINRSLSYCDEREQSVLNPSRSSNVSESRFLHRMRKKPPIYSSYMAQPKSTAGPKPIKSFHQNYLSLPFQAKMPTKCEIVCEILIAILLPPLGVGLSHGCCTAEFFICLILTILGYIPGIIYALYAIVFIDRDAYFDDYRKPLYV